MYAVSEQQARRAEEIIRSHNGLIRSSQAIAEGIHPRTLYYLRDTGRIETLGRGLYRLADMPATEDPDLATVAALVPGGIICLISALSFHAITTQIPHAVYLALGRTLRLPAIEWPPVRLFRFSGQALSSGIESYLIDGVDVKVYSAAKTIADCFKFRNKIGEDVAVEALRYSLERRKALPVDILHYARICRVERVMRPYISAIL
jgi:predicted transcriptional regulator of viral defense system